MKILITGGAGFIGSNIARRLLSLGHSVVVFDNFETGKKSNLKNLNVEIVEGDIADFDSLLSSLSKVSAICHHAALPSVPRSIEEPILTNQTNIQGTLNVLEAAKISNIKRVIFAASSSFYGDSSQKIKIETLPFTPLSPYALQKGTGELYCHLYNRLYGLETLCLRYFNVFGPYQDPNSTYSAVIPLFIKKMLSSSPPTINGLGDHSRDFTYIDNVVEANVRALTIGSKAWGETINIATGASVSLNSLVEKINDILGTNIVPKYGPARSGDIKHSLSNISKARDLIGYRPTIFFDEGLKKTVEWYKND